MGDVNVVVPRNMNEIIGDCSSRSLDVLRRLLSENEDDESLAFLEVKFKLLQRMLGGCRIELNQAFVDRIWIK